MSVVMVEIGMGSNEALEVAERIGDVCEGEPLPVVIGALCASLVTCISMSTDRGKEYRELVASTMERIRSMASIEALRRAVPGGNA